MVLLFRLDHDRNMPTVGVVVVVIYFLGGDKSTVKEGQMNNAVTKEKEEIGNEELALLRIRTQRQMDGDTTIEDKQRLMELFG